MIEREKLLNSLCACRHEPGYDCKKDCVFYEIGSAECIEMLLDNLHEYIGDLEDAKAERDRLADDLQKIQVAYVEEEEVERMLYQDLAEAEEERDRLIKENQNLRKRARIWKRAEDEKPPYNTQVKLWTNEGFEYIGVYTYSKEFITDGFIELTHKVTHWMKLDEAPERGEGEENA